MTDDDQGRAHVHQSDLDQEAEAEVDHVRDRVRDREVVPARWDQTRMTVDPDPDQSLPNQTERHDWRNGCVHSFLYELLPFG